MWTFYYSIQSLLCTKVGLVSALIQQSLLYHLCKIKVTLPFLTDFTSQWMTKNGGANYAGFYLGVHICNITFGMIPYSSKFSQCKIFISFVITDNFIHKNFHLHFMNISTKFAIKSVNLLKYFKSSSFSAMIVMSFTKLSQCQLRGQMLVTSANTECIEFYPIYIAT